MIAKIDQLFAQWQEGLCPGGQVSVRYKGEMVYERCFGYANVELEVKVSPQTVFHVASVSKQLTVMALMLLYEDGLVDLDADIRTYIPERVNFPQKVTVRQLMNNVSGVRDIWTLQGLRGTRIDDTITQEDALKIIGNQAGLNFEPGAQYMYSNSNFVLIAEIVEKLSGKSFNEFLKERVFTPLGMTSTCVRETYWQLIPNRATSYRDMSTHFLHNVLNYGTYGATSLHTTATDFLKWMENYKKPTICKPETLEIMKTPAILNDGKPSTYAGGLMVGELEGHKYIQHSGSDASFRAHMISFLDDDLEMVICSNTGNIPLGNQCMQIARYIFGLETPLPEPKEEFPYQVDDFDLNDAPGFYFSKPPEIMGINIIKKGDELFVQEGYGLVQIHQVKGNLFKMGRGNSHIYLGNKPAMQGMMGRDVPLTKGSEVPEDTNYLFDYEGVYENEEIDTQYTVFEDEGLLYLDHFRNHRSRLYCYQRDYYVTAGNRTLGIEFMRGSGGAVLGFKIHAGRVINIGFSKIE